MIRYLSQGLKGLDVKAVQEAVNYRKLPPDPRLVPDGHFGPLTRAAVVRFQSRQRLKPDGIVGDKTRKALFPLMTFTTYLAFAQAYEPPVGRSASAASRRPGVVFASANAKEVGDVPDPDPIPIIPQLPFPIDPSDGPLKTLTLNNFSLPAPALPDSLFGLPKASAQLQAGAQLTSRNLFRHLPDSPNPSGAFVLALQQVYARNKDQDGHVELALGVQLLAPFIAQTNDGFKWAVQPYAQFTWADPFWRRGKFHLVAPFAQISGQTPLGSLDPNFSVGLFPVNITFDVSDSVSIQGQAGTVLTTDFANQRVEVNNQAALVGVFSF
jgi:peptidoglycan hydrolase-like protein with peptidoglycan-binding domain